MEFSALAKAFSASSEVCRCILKSDFLKVRGCTLLSIATKSRVLKRAQYSQKKKFESGKLFLSHTLIVSVQARLRYEDISFSTPKDLMHGARPTDLIYGDAAFIAVFVPSLTQEAFQELADLNGATSVAVTFGQEAPHLQLSATGALGSR